MKITDRQNLFLNLGEKLSKYIVEGFPPDLEDAIIQSQIYNPWFTKENIFRSFENLTKCLSKESLVKWIASYEHDIPATSKKRVAVIMAGNIPLVGFHDFLCVLISGHDFSGKLSSLDRFLLPAIGRELIKIEGSLNDSIIFTEERISDYDAVIATGSNNTSNYFDFYFGKYPHIIRKNRNSIAILTGSETGNDLELLANDIFTYFGLGCRNVTKIYVPINYDLSILKQAFTKYRQPVFMHNKYMNNYDYNKSIMLLNSIPFKDFEFIMLKEDTQFASPISVLHYEYYDDILKVLEYLTIEREKIQCLVVGENYNDFSVSFGKSQQPELWDYADGVDTMKFLLSL
jgi:hypothetical protein